MESYLPISFINDFVFCPRSIYCHQFYRNTSYRLYQNTAQIEGRAAHRTVDSHSYSTSKHILQGIDVFSDEYNLGGKIDIFDQRKRLLTERKKKIKVIYDGYIFQLYAQYFCLKEMGYEVTKLKLYSMDDNKSYSVEMPYKNKLMRRKFLRLLSRIRNHDINEKYVPDRNKCVKCIYRNICDSSEC